MGITRLLRSLGEALDHMEGSGFVREVLDGELVDAWLEHKRREHREYLEAERFGESEAHQWELKRYLKRVQRLVARGSFLGRFLGPAERGIRLL